MGVFLVGETPKTGIHQAAFDVAVHLIEDLSGGTINDTLKILGPTYSGSALSLRIALERWYTRSRGASSSRHRIDVVTGSATAPCLEYLLQLGPAKAVSFYRAVVPLDVLLYVSLSQLKLRMGWDLRKVVLITELDTAFGQSVQQSGAHMPDRACQPEEMLEGVTVVRFPSHISAIRTARAAAGRDKTQTDTNQLAQVAPRPSRTDLQLSLADDRKNRDAVPDASPLSAPANEIAIANLVDAIARDGIRYVGIMATDVRDTLFLADRVRSLARNVTLFGIEGDLLYLHQQVHAAMSGMIVISSSPLFISSTSEHPSRTDAYGDAPWQFASSFQRGIFQATVELLSSFSPGAIARNDAGQVWISVVGADALWPLAGEESAGSGHAPELMPEQILSFEKLVRLEEGKAPESPTGKAERLVAGSPSVKADIELLLFAVALCAGAWWLHKAALLPAPPSVAAAEVGTRWLLASGLAVLALAAAFLLVLCELPHQEVPGSSRQPIAWESRQILVWFGLTACYLFLVAAAICAATIRRSPARREPPQGGTPFLPGEKGPGRRRERLLASLAGLVLALSGLATMPWLGSLICTRWMLCGVDFDQRVRAFASGVSPLVSLAWLIGALYLWVLVELKRRRLTAWQRIDWPLAEACEPAFTGGSRLLERIRVLLSTGFSRSWRRWLVLVGLALAPLCLVWHAMQPVAETPEFGRLLLVLWTFVAVLSAISCYRFLRVWQVLRKLLVRIASTPIADRLENLSPHLYWQPLQAFGLPLPPFETLIRSLVRLQQLQGTGALFLNAREARKLTSVLGLAFDANSRGRVDEEIASRAELEQLIATLSSQLEAHRGEPEVADFFAIRVVAYLRYVFAQLRSSLVSAVGPGLLVLLAAAAYTFEPKGAVSLGLFSLVLGEIVIAVSVFVMMSRDTVLSLIAGNRPGEVTFDWHFTSSLLTFGVLPLLGLIATQIPAAGQVLNGWVKPLLRLGGVG